MRQRVCVCVCVHVCVCVCVCVIDSRCRVLCPLSFFLFFLFFPLSLSPSLILVLPTPPSRLCVSNLFVIAVDSVVFGRTLLYPHQPLQTTSKKRQLATRNPNKNAQANTLTNTCRSRNYLREQWHTCCTTSKTTQRALVWCGV